MEEFDQLQTRHKKSCSKVNTDTGNGTVLDDDLGENERNNNSHNLFGFSSNNSTTQQLRSIESMLTRIFTIGQNVSIDWTMLSEQWALLSNIDQEQLGLHNLKQSAGLVTRDSSLPKTADGSEKEQYENSSSVETDGCQTRHELQFPPQRSTHGGHDIEV